MQSEQVGDLVLVRRQGPGMALSRRALTRKNLSVAFNALLSDESYKRNMPRLKEIQDQINGPMRTIIHAALSKRGYHHAG